MPAVIVHGPAACGKTLNAKELAKAYGKSKIVDGYDWEWRNAPLPSNAIAFTNHPPQRWQGVYTVVAFDDAIKRVPEAKRIMPNRRSA